MLNDVIDIVAALLLTGVCFWTSVLAGQDKDIERLRRRALAALAWTWIIGIMWIYLGGLR